MFFFLPLLLLFVPLFSHIATTENEPSSLIEGVVSAVTGELYAIEEDKDLRAAKHCKLLLMHTLAK